MQGGVLNYEGRRYSQFCMTHKCIFGEYEDETDYDEEIGEAWGASLDVCQCDDIEEINSQSRSGLGTGDPPPCCPGLADTLGSTLLHPLNQTSSTIWYYAAYHTISLDVTELPHRNWSEGSNPEMCGH